MLQIRGPHHEFVRLEHELSKLFLRKHQVTDSKTLVAQRHCASKLSLLPVLFQCHPQKPPLNKTPLFLSLNLKKQT